MAERQGAARDPCPPGHSREREPGHARSVRRQGLRGARSSVAAGRWTVGAPFAAPGDDASDWRGAASRADAPCRRPAAGQRQLALRPHSRAGRRELAFGVGAGSGRRKRRSARTCRGARSAAAGRNVDAGFERTAGAAWDGYAVAERALPLDPRRGGPLWHGPSRAGCRGGGQRARLRRVRSRLSSAASDWTVATNSSAWLASAKPFPRLQSSGRYRGLIGAG